MKPIILFLLLLTVTAGANADVAERADSAYFMGNYKKAKSLYEEALLTTKHPDIYYNLGNAEFRLGNLPAALLAYHRTLKYNPAHEKAAHNIKVCEERQHIAFERPEEMFFFTFYREFKQGSSANVWTVWTIVFFAFSLLCMAVCICSKIVWLRRLSFFAAIIFIVCFGLTTQFALEAKNRLETPHAAIVMKAAEVKPSPFASAKTEMELIPGTKVELLSTDGDWANVELPDATEGWVMKSLLETI